MNQQRAGAQRIDEIPEDAESIALALQLQQEDDDNTLRNAIGVQEEGAEGMSPSMLTYEQLLALGETMGAVSKGAKGADIAALDTVTVGAARADLPSGRVIMGEKCSICCMEFEEEEELRVLPCKHAEHKVTMTLIQTLTMTLTLQARRAHGAPYAARTVAGQG